MAIVASIFGDLASRSNLQALIDNSIDSLYSRALWRQHLDVGLPQLELTFESAIGRSRVEAAASIVDPDAPAPLRARSALELLKGGIPTMKEKFSLNQKDYRALLALENLPISQGERKTALIKKLWNDLENAATSTDRRLDIMFLQAVSTFKIDISILNNPDGAPLGEIDLLAKADQKRTVGVTWTQANAATADPFKDIRDVVTFATASGRRFKEIWIDQELWLTIQNFTKVKEAISGYMNPGSNQKFLVTFDRVNEYLVANGLPPFKLINERRGIEKDGVIQVMNPFKKENIVFIPEGKLGILHNAIAIEEMAPIQGITYAKYDKTLMKKWRDNDPWLEFTGVELNAFPGLEAIDGIFILQSDVAA